MNKLRLKFMIMVLDMLLAILNKEKIEMDSVSTKSWMDLREEIVCELNAE